MKIVNAMQAQSTRCGRNKGYARNFDRPELHEGRIEKAAKWPVLNGKARMDKPWLDGLPRVIFISDMGDALVEACLSLSSPTKSLSPF